MTTKNSATPKYYNIVVGNKTEKLDYSTSEISKTINNMDDNTVTVFAVDSRGNQKDKTKSLDIVEYSETVLQTVKIERKKGVGETILISLSGKYANINFGAKTNTVKSIQFRKKSKTETEFESWVEIKQFVTINTENGTFSCDSKEITGQTFTLGTEYDIEVQVKDELSSDTEPVSLNSGKVLLSALKNKGISVGGIYNEKLGGPLQLDNKNVIDWINGKQDKIIQKVLWSGIQYMTADHTITLSEPISQQTSGIVLIFSAYDGEAKPYNFHCFFVPKQFVSLYNGKGMYFSLVDFDPANDARKYLYINDTTIQGNANNGGVHHNLNNSKFVLREVIGV